MDYDIVLPKSAFKITELKCEGMSAKAKKLAVRVLAENNSYLPLGDKYISLYVARSDDAEHLSECRLVHTRDGHDEAELEFAYPMQTVSTKEEFILIVEDEEDVYLIARVNDKDEKLAAAPSSLGTVEHDSVWGVMRLGEGVCSTVA